MKEFEEHNHNLVQLNDQTFKDGTIVEIKSNAQWYPTMKLRFLQTNGGKILQQQYYLYEIGSLMGSEPLQTEWRDIELVEE